MPHTIVGWDIGGAHAKACVWQDDVQSRGQAGRQPGVQAVMQWPCPLWRGLDELDAVLRRAQADWPVLADAQTRHAVTMTGEMADAFSDRRTGVAAIAGRLVAALPGTVAFYAGDAGWCTNDDDVGALWPQVASANWLATATLCAQRLGGDGLLLDIGSTTTDVIAWRGGRPATTARSDAERLVSGELVYHGVVRTPLCAVAPSVVFRGARTGVMNELFATTADVYRLTGELYPEHDQHPAADGGAKDLPRSRQRLARMVGRDAAEADDADWLALADHWRSAQLATIAAAVAQVAAAHAVPVEAPVVTAGCGAFLATRLAAHAGRSSVDFASAVVGLAPESATADWARVAAPCVAVAALYATHCAAP